MIKRWKQWTLAKCRSPHCGFRFSFPYRRHGGRHSVCSCLTENSLLLEKIIQCARLQTAPSLSVCVCWQKQKQISTVFETYVSAGKSVSPIFPKIIEKTWLELIAAAACLLFFCECRHFNERWKSITKCKVRINMWTDLCWAVNNIPKFNQATTHCKCKTLIYIHE